MKVDGFNVVTSVEAALSGGVLLGARDGSLRDMASMHGNYRKVEETQPALAAIADVITAHDVASCRWLLDAPVSNSGRLKSVILALAEERGLSWTVDVVADPDPVLIAAPEGIVIASADGQVLDGAQKTWYLARATVDSRLGTTPWIVDLSTEVEGS